MKTRNLLLALILLVHSGPGLALAITSGDALPGEPDPAADVPHDGTPHDDPAPPPDVSGEVTLRDVLAATLQSNPRLTAYSWELRSSDAKVLQAGLRPNPELSISPENFVGSGAFGRQVQSQNTLQLSQLIELGDKRQLRREAASATLDRTQVEYESTRIDVLGTATVDFIDVVTAQEVVRIARMSVNQAEELVRAVEKRTRASISAPLEEKRARILAARARNTLNEAVRALRATKLQLAANLGSRGPGVRGASGDLFTTHPVPPLDELLERTESAPERRVALADEKVRVAEAALARSRRVSDVVVSGAWRQGRNWDDQAVVAGVTFPLKIFDRAQGDIAASDAQVEKSKVETTSVDVRLRAAVFGLYQEIVQAKEVTEGMAREIVPQTEQAMALAKSGFAQGIYTQLDLLDAQRTLIEVRLEYVQAGAKYHRLVAEVEKLLGAPLEGSRRNK
jgi:cobalt-zinc-cadmium efflux system outer membrane protein